MLMASNSLFMRIIDGKQSLPFARVLDYRARVTATRKDLCLRTGRNAPNRKASLLLLSRRHRRREIRTIASSPLRGAQYLPVFEHDYRYLLVHHHMLVTLQ